MYEVTVSNWIVVTSVWLVHQQASKMFSFDSIVQPSPSLLQRLHLIQLRSIIERFSLERNQEGINMSKHSRCYDTKGDFLTNGNNDKRFSTFIYTINRYKCVQFRLEATNCTGNATQFIIQSCICCFLLLLLFRLLCTVHWLFSELMFSF